MKYSLIFVFFGGLAGGFLYHWLYKQRNANYNPDPKVIEEYIDTNQRDPLEMLIDLVKSNQCLVIGEEHVNRNAKRFITNSLYDMKAEGIGYLAVELRISAQKHIDDYIRGRISEKEIRENIGYEYLERSCSFDMIEMARKAGINILAIDNNDWRALNRDFFMLEIIKSNILDKDPDAKFLVYIGGNHAVEGDLGLDHKKKIAGYLDNLIESACVRIMSPSFISNAVDLSHLPEKIGFLTDYPPLSQMRLGTYSLIIPSFQVDLYYGKHIDAIIILSHIDKS